MKFKTPLAAVAVSVICGFSVLRSLPRSQISQPSETRRNEPSQPEISNVLCNPTRATRAAEIINRVQKLAYKDYEIETRERTASIDGYPKPVEVAYVIVRHKGKEIAKFDADIYFPLGNSAEAGLFPLLGTESEQLIVSQGISRTGVQWVADLSTEFKIIFDGQKFHVGREAIDMTIADLNSDGVQEITVPITSFYGFEKWRLTTSETPLPDIIFKYNSSRRKYLPANPQFRECLLKKIDETEQRMSSREDERLGAIMSVTLDYIFAGEEQRGWMFFDEMYRRPDKSSIKRAVQRELKSHPVYQYLKRAASLERHRTAIRTIDFKNSSFPAKPIYAERGFRLTGGKYRGRPGIPGAGSPFGDPYPVSLTALAYGDVTRDSKEDAIVILYESTAGTAITYYLYVYTMKANHPKLLWAVATGDRAQGGLRKAFADRGDLVIELYGDNSSIKGNVFGDDVSACCPSSFTRTRYRWDGRQFVQYGKSEVTRIDKQSASLEMEYQEPN